jgi:hypothetical protein
MAKGGLAALTLAAALGTVPAAPAVAQEEGRPAADAPSRKVIRTKRLRVPADLFEGDAVFFKRARVEAGGMIRADGHNLDLYGMELIPPQPHLRAGRRPLGVRPARVHGFAGLAGRTIY